MTLSDATCWLIIDILEDSELILYEKIGLCRDILSWEIARENQRQRIAGRTIIR